jgi:hypothetical protein
MNVYITLDLSLSTLLIFDTLLWLKNQFGVNPGNNLPVFKNDAQKLEVDVNIEVILPFQQQQQLTTTSTTDRAGVSNSNLSKGHIPKKNCSAGRSLLEKSFCGP